MSLLTKLGLDLSEFSAGWNRASTIAETGADGLGKAVERKLGLKDVFKSFVASVGIDVKSIANFIAESFGVGEKQQKQMEELAELSDKVAEANIKNNDARLTDEQKYQRALQRRDDLLRIMGAREIKTTEDQIKQKKDELALAEQIAKVQEFEAKAAKERAEASKQELEARVDLGQKEFEASLKNLTLEEKSKLLKDKIYATDKLLGTGVFGTGEERQRQNSERNKGLLAEIPADIEARNNAKAQKAKEDHDRKVELITRRDRKQADVNEARQNLQNFGEDRGKLTLAELAGIGQHQFGVPVEIDNQSRTAREIQDIQKKAEEARLSGRSDDATALLDQADKLKGGLSALTSGEREDPAKALKKALETSELELADINKTLAGKFANQ